MSAQRIRGRDVLLGVAALVLALAVATGIGAGLWWAVKKAMSTLAEIEGEGAIAAITAAGTVLAGVITVVLGQAHAKNRDVQEAHRPEKARIYGEYMRMMVDLLKATKGSGKKNPTVPSKQLVDAMYAFKRDLVVWGSPQVIRAYHKLEREGWTKGGAQGVVAWDNLLRAMRKDLGNSNLSLAQGQLVDLFLQEGALDDLKAMKSTDEGT